MTRIGGAAGVTLAELVVALGLFALVLLGVLMAWTKAQEAYFVGAEVAEVQQSLRAAIDFMARELRAAGRDATLCAFDYLGAAGGADCAGGKVGACQARLGGGYGADNGLPGGGPGCMGLAAIPYREATASGIRVRSDRNDNGRIAGMANAVASGGGADRAEEDVTYAWSAGPGCPSGVPRCLTRDDGSGAIALLAAEITAFQLTYFPRPGVGPCAGAGSPPVLPTSCPSFALPLQSQAEADGIARIRVEVTAVGTVAGQPIGRTASTDVVLESRR